jgi:hypothetical protein
MKTKNKSIITAMALLAIVALIFIACDKEDPHTHEWGAWKSNATQHWQECTSNDGATTTPANHTGNPCTVCSYETEKDQSDPITNLFDGTCSVTVEGNFTSTEWSDILTLVETALNAGYLDYPPAAHPGCLTYFKNNSVKIKVERTDEYE